MRSSLTKPLPMRMVPSFSLFSRWAARASCSCAAVMTRSSTSSSASRRERLREITCSPLDMGL